MNVQDKGLQLLTALPKLKEIRCAQCKISKVDVSGLVNLESLDLTYATFRDEGLKSLQNLRKLRRLYLRDTLVTDQGLRYLSGLVNLEELSDKDLERLQKEFERIHHAENHHGELEKAERE